MGPTGPTVLARLLARLEEHVASRSIGRVVGATFVSTERLADGGAPDLVVEVVEGEEIGDDLTARLEACMEAGTQRYWVLFPAMRTAWVIRASGTTDWLDEAGELLGEGVVTGFRCSLADLFDPPESLP